MIRPEAAAVQCLDACKIFIEVCTLLLCHNIPGHNYDNGVCRQCMEKGVGG